MTVAGPPNVEALSRGLQVLRCFAGVRRPLGSSDLARMTGLPQPTVWRLCKTLERGGYLVPDGGEGRYRPGLALLGLGFAALDAMVLPELLRPHLQALASQFSVAASLAGPNEINMIFAQRCETNATLTANLRVGSVIPMITSGTGWAHLASLGADARQALLERIAREQPEAWQRGAPGFRAAHDEFERTGVIINLGTFVPGLSTAAVPLIHPETGISYVLSCSGLMALVPPDRLRREIGPALLRIAAEFGRPGREPAG
jgi:DNA-binding IclR family transcriptional regulator